MSEKRAMAAQAASTIASAVIGEIADRTLTKVMQKLHSPPAAHEKLLRLELLMLKVRSAIEVSEKHAIESASLLEWRDRLKEEAAEAGEVLLHFQRRATEEAEAARSAADHDRQQSTASGGTGALYFTRSSLSGMVQRVRDAARRLLSTDEDMKKLDRSLENMETLSPDITQFVTLLQLDVSRSRKQGQRPAKRRAPPSLPPYASDCCLSVKLSDSKQRPTVVRSAKAVAALEDMQGVSAEAEDRQKEARILGSVLEKALRRLMESCHTKATNRDMEGLEWMAQWAAILREAVERGGAVLLEVCPRSEGSREAGGALEADDEVYSFARAVEWMALDLQCFDLLLSLCPWKQRFFLLQPLRSVISQCCLLEDSPK